MERINFNTPATIGAVEHQVNNFFMSLGREPQSLLLDFSGCEFIEVTSLCYLTSFIASRKQKKLETSIKLPESKDVRDFMRVWEFPKALKHATGLPFSKVVVPEDLRFFGENFSPDEIKYAQTINYDNRLSRLLSNKFFSFICYSVNPYLFSSRTAFDECHRWQDRLIASVLKNHLQGPEDYVANRVIFEAMTNTLRHPDAHVVQTVSFLQGRRESEPDTQRLLTIVIWDDGVGMVDTLRDAIRKGKKIRSTEPQELHTKYLFVTEKSSGKKTGEEIVGSDFCPTLRCPDEKLLLTECFPGITRDISGEHKIDHPEIKKEILLRPGMGLFILVNAVVDVFGGSVAYRTGEVFMTVRRPTQNVKEQVQYRVKAVHNNGGSPQFLGNMITIRLPLS